MEQTITPPSTKGIIIGLILIVISIVIYFADIPLDGPAKWVGNVIFILGIIWSVYSYGKQINYNATFGNYFAHGFKVTAIATSIMVIYLIVFIVLFPEFKEKGIEQARIGMQKNKELTEEQISKGLEITKKFFMVFVIGGSLIVYLIFGSLASLVGAAITKKEPVSPIGGSNQPLQ